MADKDTYLVTDVVGNVFTIVGSDRLADYLSRGFTQVKPQAPSAAKK